LSFQIKHHDLPKQPYQQHGRDQHNQRAKDSDFHWTILGLYSIAGQMAGDAECNPQSSDNDANDCENKRQDRYSSARPRRSGRNQAFAAALTKFETGSRFRATVWTVHDTSNRFNEFAFSTTVKRLRFVYKTRSKIISAERGRSKLSRRPKLATLQISVLD